MSEHEESRFSFVTVNSYCDNSNESNNFMKMSYNDLKENFEDMPLQKGKKNIPFLIIEDKGDKKDYLGSYKNYEISIVNEKNEKRILCNRRYDNFDCFYNKIKKKYPIFLIPRLIGKNPLTKIITYDLQFYDKRRNQLSYFLNYILNHDKLKDSREFLKFLNDPEFDNDFFKKDENLFNFPEANKCSDNITSKIYGVFTNFFSQKEEYIQHTENELKLKKYQNFYGKMFENLKEIKKSLVIYIDNVNKLSSNFAEISNNLFYLKDVVFESSKTNESFFNYHHLCNELSKVNKNHYNETGLNLENKFEGFISVFQGVCDIFERYEEFIKVYNHVHKAMLDYRENPSRYNGSKLNKELNDVNTIKINFEQMIIEEIDEFIKKYSNQYSDIIESYKSFIKSINMNESTQLNIYSNYFK